MGRFIDRIKRLYSPDTILNCIAIGGAALYVSAWGYLGFLGAKIMEEQERAKQYAIISNAISDSDGKPGTSLEDWAIAYSKTFPELSVTTTPPEKLGLGQMDKILEQIARQ